MYFNRCGFILQNVALHAQHTRRERIDVDDVNTVLRLMDVEPVIGAQLAQWVPLGDPDNLCVPVVGSCPFYLHIALVDLKNSKLDSSF